MMYLDNAKTLLREIDVHNDIIVLTHKQPDMDAYGSQLGLMLTLKKNFPQKNIYALMDSEPDEEFAEYYSCVDDAVFVEALVIATDTPSPYMINDDRYRTAKKTIEIDHHAKRTSFCDISIIDDTAISACQMVYLLAEEMQLSLDNEIAACLMKGLVADSGRFRYNNVNNKTFYVASKLMEYDIDLNTMFKKMYSADINHVRYKGVVMSQFKTINNVAFMRNTKEMVEESPLSLFDISRGMVNAMSDIKGIDIWVNFTYSPDGILAEIRSSSKTVNHIASKYGGGGHDLACGATLKSWDDADKMIEDLCKI